MKRTIISWYFVSFQWRCCWKKVPENRCHSTAQNPRPLFATLFLQQNIPITFPSPPLLPAELKSIILVLPWARVRYLCGMVGKRKRGREGEYILRWKSFASSDARWTQLCRRANLLIFLNVLLENFICFTKTCRSKLQEKPIQVNTTFFVTNSFLPSAIFWRLGGVLFLTIDHVGSLALSLVWWKRPCQKAHVLMFFIYLVKILDSNFPNCLICLQLINSNHKGPSIKVKK